MLDISEFIKDYLSENQIGFADDIISNYLRIIGIDNSKYDYVKSEVEESLKKIPNIIFSEVTGKFFLKSFKSINSTISKLQNLQSFLSGRIINEINQIKFSKISREDIETNLEDFEIINLIILNHHLLINSEFDNISVTIEINQKSFNIRTEYKKDFEEVFPYLAFLEGKDDYAFNKKGYLPLDSILYLSFIKIRNLINSKYTDLILKIDIFEHIQ
ncbi:hypothetical protein LCGC14_0849670 [marine sediment metagenome]|uniref:Uncharacterized protein n=1 Tax=marine sediment metagenome TaxID=412755 RepID=A0A0F9PFH1_9ZZZZ